MHMKNSREDPQESRQYRKADRLVSTEHTAANGLGIHTTLQNGIRSQYHQSAKPTLHPDPRQTMKCHTKSPPVIKDRLLGTGRYRTPF